MNRVVATIILRLIISRTIPMPTAMMIGDIKHQSKSAGKRNLFQLSLIASWWSKHCMAIMGSADFPGWYDGKSTCSYQAY
jgi:hypothetical protein